MSEVEQWAGAELDFEFYEQVDKLKALPNHFVLAFSDGVFNPAYKLTRREAEELMFQMAAVLGWEVCS